MREMRDFGAQGNLLARGDHSLPGSPFVLNRMRRHTRAKERFRHGAEITPIDLPSVTQFGDESVLYHRYSCVHVVASRRNSQVFR